MANADDPINSIFFEKQQDALCAQHALNMLLQDALYTVTDLRELAHQTDKLENELMGNNADAAGRSENMNDSGYFSIQVIERALVTFDLKIKNIESPEMASYKDDPLSGRAYICNFREHWFVIRKFGAQWFELNSIERGPKLLSDTYLKEYLHQLALEKYSIFVVLGILPDSAADQLISLCPVEPKQAPKKEQKEQNMVQKFFNSVGRRLGGSSEIPDNSEERDLAIAMAMSMESSSAGSGEEEELRKAIEMSLGSDGAPSAPTETPIMTSSSTPSVEQQRKDREMFLQRLEQKK